MLFMSRRHYDGEERITVLDRFAGLMNFLSEDRILIPFSYLVISLCVGAGMYQIIDSKPKNEIENKVYERGLEAVAYDLPRQR